jgi:hypothetical protein
VSAIVPCALSLQYERLGVRFTNRAMFSNFLLRLLRGSPSEY